MNNLRIFFVLSILSVVLPMEIYAETISLVDPLPPFSPANFLLHWESKESVADATYTIFYRIIDTEGPSPWQEAAGLVKTCSTAGFFLGEHGKTYEFRSALFSPAGDEMAVIADFDHDPGSSRVWAVSTTPGISRTMQLNLKETAQGDKCFQSTFCSHLNSEDEIPNGSLIGLRFNDQIPLRDWSAYHFLEFYYWSDIPNDMDLWLETSTVGLRTPVRRFSENGENPRQWHTIIVDLDKTLGPPETRTQITSIALSKPAAALQANTIYTVRIDGVRLWKDRCMVRTTVDATPPTDPGEIQYDLKPGKLTWTWKPSEDPESGVTGYAYLFTRDLRIPFPTTVLTATPSLTVPFAPLPTYQDHYFMVAARNGAGVWSPVIQRMVTFKP